MSLCSSYWFILWPSNSFSLRQQYCPPTAPLTNVSKLPCWLMFLSPRAKRMCRMCRDAVINMHALFFFSFSISDEKAEKMPSRDIQLSMCHQRTWTAFSNIVLACIHMDVSVLNVYDWKASFAEQFLSWCHPVSLKCSAAMLCWQNNGLKTVYKMML